MNIILVLMSMCTAMVFGRPDGHGAPRPRQLLDSYAAPINSGNSGPYANSAPVYGPPTQQQQTVKHVYIHVPPPEPTIIQTQKKIVIPPGQKHYKIVFIKAPTPPTPTIPDIQISPQAEQKTLIYVLVKKPDDAPEINIPTPAPTQPSKPEVYFIRYKTQKQEGYPDSGVPQSQSQYNPSSASGPNDNYISSGLGPSGSFTSPSGSGPY